MYNRQYPFENSTLKEVQLFNIPESAYQKDPITTVLYNYFVHNFRGHSEEFASYFT